MADRIDALGWLLEGEPWVRYRTRVDLLRQSEKDAEVRAARRELLAHPLVNRLLAELSKWPGPALKSHKDASHLTHKLAFAADLGLSIRDEEIRAICSKILDRRSGEGPFEIVTRVPVAFGGSGEGEPAWMLCDAPTVLHALLSFGLAKNARVGKAMRYLLTLVRENGWPCAVSPSLGKFQGPGRRGDPCPYATLLMLKALSDIPELHGSRESRIGVEALLSLWERRTAAKPYLFGMGADFMKLKAPFIWYDILHVVDVLSRFPWAARDRRLKDMAAIVAAQADANGRFTALSRAG